MGIWKDKTRKEWVYEFQYRRKSYGARGFATRREAVTAREKRRKEIKAESKLTQPGMGFKEAASAYLDYSERRHAQRTYDYKALTYRTFIGTQGNPFLNDNDLVIRLRSYLNEMQSNAVYNARRKDLSAMFEWSIKTYKLPMVNPCKELDKMPHTPKTKQVPTDQEVLKLIFVAAPGDEQDIIMCCIHLLARIDEILRMEWEYVNFEKRVVTLWTRKRKGGAYEPDDQPMNEDLHKTLFDRWQNRGSNKWVFYNEGTEDRYHHRPKMMASLCKRAGIPPIRYSKRKVPRGKNKGKLVDFPLYFGFHVLRHFMASLLADQEKVGVKAVSGLLRHKNLRTTEIYLHSIDEGQRIAIDKIQGKFTSKKDDPQATPTSIKEKESPANGVTP